MPDDGVTTEGQARLDALMTQLQPVNFIKVIVRAAVKIAEQVRAVIEPAPGPPSHPLKWASRKSRAYYFAMRRKKGYPDEYTRTSDPMSQKMSQAWVVRETQDGAILGNPAAYADLVQSEERQTEMHKATGWRTDVEAVRVVEESGIIGQYIAAEIDSFIKGLV